MANARKAKVTLEDFSIFDERAALGREVARAIDSGTPIPHAVQVRTHTFANFLRVLTPKRNELLQLAKSGKKSIADLAAATDRDQSAVRRDIAKLADLGLVNVVVKSNARNGKSNVVRVLDGNIEVQSKPL
jgi:predicted transcriptional regulator